MTADGSLVGHGALGTTEGPVLVMVDCQRLFTLDGAPGTRVAAAAEAAGRAAAGAREAGIPVVWLRTIYATDDELGPVWRVKAPGLAELRPGAALSAFDERCGYVEGEEVVTKQRASGFVGTDLTDRLRSRGAVTVAVAGFTTAGCVRATAVDAASVDFCPVVLSDAVADRSDALHDAALTDLDQRYADVMGSAAWLAQYVGPWTSASSSRSATTAG